MKVMIEVEVPEKLSIPAASLLDEALAGVVTEFMRGERSGRIEDGFIGFWEAT